MKEGIPVFEFEIFQGETDLVHFVTTRTGGCSSGNYYCDMVCRTKISKLVVFALTIIPTSSFQPVVMEFNVVVLPQV